VERLDSDTGVIARVLAHWALLLENQFVSL
jgi:hypothetical protein